MREILFRGKRIDNDELIYGNLMIWSDKSTSIDDSGDEGAPFYAVYPDTVAQYSSRTDIHGHRIFEGDILTGLFLYGEKIEGVCAFENGSFGIQWNRGKVKEFTPFTSTCNIKFEVIGNIHDNPDLLGGDDN